MGLIAKETGGSKFPPIEPGMHHAVCYGIYDLGTHYDEKFKKYNRKVVILFELPEERIEIEKDGATKSLPRATSKKFTNSLHSKSILRGVLQSWRGKPFTAEELEGFDLVKLLGVNAMVQILHNEKGYAYIATITSLVKGFEKRTPENPLAFFSFEEDKDIPEQTPEWLVKEIQASSEWTDKNSNHAPSDNPPPPGDDDIPF